MIKIKLTQIIILVLLILGSLHIPSLEVTADHLLDNSYFSQINHTPLSPINDTSVDFNVYLRNSVGLTINNLTLSLLEPISQSYQMNKIDDNRYRFSTIVNSTGEFRYNVKMFADDELLEISNNYSIFVRDNLMERAKIKFLHTFAYNFQKGNYSLVSEDEQFRLDLNIGNPVNLKVNQSEDNHQLPPDKIKLSDSYIIRVNNSEAINHALLVMKYNMTILENLDILPETLEFSSRKQFGGIWKSYQPSINSSEQTISLALVNFSEWIITASIPQLRFIDSETSLTTTTDQYLSINATAKNFGSYPAVNTTMKIITTSSVLLNNISNMIIIEEIDPLNEITIAWNVYFTEIGEYTLVIILECNNGDGDIIEVQVNVQVPNDISSDTNESTLFVQLSFTIVMIAIGLYVYRKKQ